MQSRGRGWPCVRAWPRPLRCVPAAGDQALVLGAKGDPVREGPTGTPGLNRRSTPRSLRAGPGLPLGWGDAFSWGIRLMHGQSGSWRIWVLFPVVDRTISNITYQCPFSSKRTTLKRDLVDSKNKRWIPQANRDTPPTRVTNRQPRTTNSRRDKMRLFMGKTRVPTGLAWPEPCLTARRSVAGLPQSEPGACGFGWRPSPLACPGYYTHHAN
jgi:hypothetical protein